MTKTLEQRLNELDAKRARLMDRKRKQDTRQKIIVGAIIIDQARADANANAKLLTLLDAKVTRDNDRAAIAPLIEKLKGQQDDG